MKKTTFIPLVQEISEVFYIMWHFHLGHVTVTICINLDPST